MTTTRPHTNRDDVSELERLRKEYDAAVKRRDGKIGATGLEIRADALIAALGDEIAELTGQNIDLEVWRASAVKRAEQAEAEVALRDRMLVAEYDSPTPKTAGYMRWFTDLRARAEKEATDAT